ncbi:MAG: SURF1 family protein [Actinomycetota bacterium]|nr:SURF1 family protein [Actinomycetota bacterium]
MTRLLAPRYWGGHLLMLLAVGIAIALGLWQLHAWEARRAAASAGLSSARPVSLDKLMGGDDPFPGNAVGRPVTLSGRWLGPTLYVSDRVRQGRTGYWVVTPLLVDGTKSAMPVVRGWAPEPQARPAVGTTHVTGWLQPGEGQGLVDPTPGDDVLPELRIASLVQRVNADLYSAFVIARSFSAGSAAPDRGLAGVKPTDAPAVSSTTALRNFLYAIEWWIFGLFAVFVWFRWCRDVLNPRSAALQEPAADR